MMMGFNEHLHVLHFVTSVQKTMMVYDSLLFNLAEEEDDDGR